MKEPSAPGENAIITRGLPLPVKEVGRQVEKRYVIQVHSTTTRADASEARNEMIGAGFPAGIFEADLGERGLWYRIYVGPYDSEYEAQIQLESIREMAGYGSSFIKALD